MPKGAAHTHRNNCGVCVYCVVHLVAQDPRTAVADYIALLLLCTRAHISHQFRACAKLTSQFKVCGSGVGCGVTPALRVASPE